VNAAEKQEFDLQ